VIPQQGVQKKSCATTAVVVSGGCSGWVVEVIEVLDLLSIKLTRRRQSERLSAKPTSLHSVCSDSALSLFHRRYNKAH
jgi:hypothetical protein